MNFSVDSVETESAGGFASGAIDSNGEIAAFDSKELVVSVTEIFLAPATGM